MILKSLGFSLKTILCNSFIVRAQHPQRENLIKLFKWKIMWREVTYDLKLETVLRDASRTAATSKMEFFVIIFTGFQPLTIVTKSSILDVAAILDRLCFSPCNFLRIWSHLLKKSLMKNFIFCTVDITFESIKRLNSFCS